MAYKHGREIYLTYEGVKRFAQLSRNKKAQENKEAFLNLLKEKAEALCATMHVSSASAAVQPIQAAPQTDSMVQGGISEIAEGNDDNCGTMMNTAIMMATGEKIDGLSTAAVQCTHNIRECGQELVKFREINMGEIMSFVTTIVDKAPVFQESVIIFVDARQRFLEQDKYALDIKQRQIELERQANIEATESKQRQIELERQANIEATESKQRQIELERQANHAANVNATESRKSQIELERQANIEEMESKQRQIDLDCKACIASTENRQRMLQMDKMEFEFSEQKKDSHKKRTQEEEAETQRKEQRREAQPMAQPQAQPMRITVSSVMGKHPTIFDGIPHNDRKSVLIKAGSRCAQLYREAGHIELPKIIEGQYNVAVYEDDFEETIIAALKSAVKSYNNQVGSVTIVDVGQCITAHLKSGEKSKVLRAAEGVAINVVLAKPGRNLMKKQGTWQTFTEEDKPMLITSIQEVMRQKYNSKAVKPLENFFASRGSASKR